MASPIIRLPYPHPGQIAIRQQAQKHNVLSAGRRWRKTTLMMAIAVEAAARGEWVVWGAPTYKQVKVGWDECFTAAGSVAEFRVQDKEARFASGGKITYRSLDDPDTARGLTANGIIVDEAGDVKETAWNEVLRPMMLGMDGWSWLVGTPRGRNWFWREYMEAPNRANSISWQVPTLGVEIANGMIYRKLHPYENPFIPFEEIQQLFYDTPQSIFRQEYLAEFLENEGSVFRNIRGCIVEDEYQPEAASNYVLGADWGQQNDFTVVTVIDAAQNRVVDIDRYNQIGWNVQRARLVQLVYNYHVGFGLLEANSIGGPNIEQLHNEGHNQLVGFDTTVDSKAQIIQALVLAFERGDIKIPNNPQLIAELEAFEATRLPSGKWRYAAPEGMHDDMVMSLALAWWAVNQRYDPGGETIYSEPWTFGSSM